MFCPIVRKKVGMGPKPMKKKKKKLPLPVNKTPCIPEKLPETSPLFSAIDNDKGEKEAVFGEVDKRASGPQVKDDFVTYCLVSVEGEDGNKKDSFPKVIRDRVFCAEDNISKDKDEHYEKSEPGEDFKVREEHNCAENCSSCCSKMGFMHADIQDREQDKVQVIDDNACEKHGDNGTSTVMHTGNKVQVIDDNACEKHGDNGTSTVMHTGNKVVEEKQYVAFKVEPAGDDEGEDETRSKVEDEAFDANNEECQEILADMHNKKIHSVYLSGLDENATEDSVKEVFQGVGEITGIKLVVDRSTKLSKGFAFLYFATVEQAKRAVTEFKNPMVSGRICHVSLCQDKDNTLFVGNICKTWTKAVLEKRLKHFGVDKFKDVSLVDDAKNDGMNRGFAFVEFSSHKDALNAYKRLQKRDVVLGVDRSAKVCFAYPSIHQSSDRTTQEKRVLLDGLPASWDYSHVENYLTKFGKIESIELARYKPSASRKDYGFVTFESHDAAIACVNAFRDSDVINGDSKVKISARISYPANKGSWKHIIRGNFHVGKYSSSEKGGDSFIFAQPPGTHGHQMKKEKTRAESFDRHGLEKPARNKGRHQSLHMKGRGGPLPKHFRSRERISPVSYCSKDSTKKHYARQDEVQSRGIAAADHSTRVCRFHKSNDSSIGSRCSSYVSTSAHSSRRRTMYEDEGLSSEGFPYEDEVQPMDIAAAYHSCRADGFCKSNDPSIGSSSSSYVSTSACSSCRRTAYEDEVWPREIAAAYHRTRGDGFHNTSDPSIYEDEVWPREIAAAYHHSRGDGFHYSSDPSIYEDEVRPRETAAAYPRTRGDGFHNSSDPSIYEDEVQPREIAAAYHCTRGDGFHNSSDPSIYEDEVRPREIAAAYHRTRGDGFHNISDPFMGSKGSHYVSTSARCSCRTTHGDQGFPSERNRHPSFQQRDSIDVSRTVSDSHSGGYNFKEAYWKVNEQEMPHYIEKHPRNEDSFSHPKRFYKAMDDVSQGFLVTQVQQCITQMEYGLDETDSYYADSDCPRAKRSCMKYVASRTSIPHQESCAHCCSYLKNYHGLDDDLDKDRKLRSPIYHHDHYNPISW